MKNLDKLRVDKLVEGASTRLASQSTRRGFLGKLAGVTGTAMFGGSVVLGEKNEAYGSTPPTGCFGSVDVSVCYAGWKCVNSEPGINGVYLRVGPSFNAPLVVNNNTNIIISNGSGNQYFCRQSARGTIAQGCTDPGPRANCNGWLWGYWNVQNWRKGGWAPYNVNGVSYLSPASSETTCCGQASVDFDCDKPKSACPGWNLCTGRSAPSVTLSTAYWDIAQPDASMPDYAQGDQYCDQGYYIRYAPGSIAHGWTYPGDKVKRYGYCGDCAEGYNWSCICGWCTAWIPYGCRGWCRSYVLGSAGSYSSCTCGGCCPSGSNP